MSKTLIPAMNLRFVNKPFVIAANVCGGGTISEKRKVLQQEFKDTSGKKSIWKDVPLVEDES